MNTTNYPEAMTALRRSKRKCALAFCWVFGVTVAGYWAAGRFDSAGIPTEVLLLPGGAWIAWRLLAGRQARRVPSVEPATLGRARPEPPADPRRVVYRLREAGASRG